MKYLIFLLTVSSFSFSQNYEVISFVLTENESNNSISNDTIHLYHKFTPLSNHYLNTENFNEESFRVWWSEIKDKQPPIELFLKNFNFEHIKSEIFKPNQNYNIDFSNLNNYFIKSDEKFIESNQEKKYVYTSKPIFNCQKDWVIIITSSYIPYVNASSGGLLKVYFKSNGNWILYHQFNLWLS